MFVETVPFPLVPRKRVNIVQYVGSDIHVSRLDRRLYPFSQVPNVAETVAERQD